MFIGEAVALLVWAGYDDKQKLERAHNSLLAIFQPYDTSPRDGVLKGSELEKFAKDHPELKPNQQTRKE